MAYQVLARKYRPKNFETLVGQDHVVRALTHALDSKRLHHAWLFTGTRGVGKTTLARILAKSLNCVGKDGKSGITSHPCGICEVCTAIDAGRFVDYIEMDAASNRGVDDMAQLLEQAIYAPTHARYKVYMIDEVHMLSNHAFNAMLKTLEEPPEHVKFILATTDPQKVPVTVLSRCLQFNLKQMPVAQIIAHLESILIQENIGFDKEALRLLAKCASGSMRDALSLTDQAIAYAAGKISQTTVQDMIGTLDQSCLSRILLALAAKSGSELLEVANEMSARSLSFSAALVDLAVFLHNIAIAQTVPKVLSNDLAEYEAIQTLAECFTAEEVQLLYQIAIHGRNELSLAPDDYAGFTMCLLRMLAFYPEGGDLPMPVIPNTPADKSKAQLTSQSTFVNPINSRMSTSVRTSPAQEALEVLGGMRTKLRTNVSSKSGFKSESKSKSTGLTTAFSTEPAIGFSTTSFPEMLGYKGDWPSLTQLLPIRGVVRELALESELIVCRQDGDTLLFELQTSTSTLSSGANNTKLAQVLSQYFGITAVVKSQAGRVRDSAALRANKSAAERQKQAEHSIYEDPFVKEIVTQFDATILPNSIRPRDPEQSTTDVPRII